MTFFRVVYLYWGEIEIEIYIVYLVFYFRKKSSIGKTVIRINNLVCEKAFFL